MQTDKDPGETPTSQATGGAQPVALADVDHALNELLDQLSGETSGTTRAGEGLDLGLEAASRLDLAQLLGQAGVEDRLVDLLVERFKLPRALAAMLAGAIVTKAKKPARRKPRRKTATATSKKTKPKKTTTRKTVKKTPARGRKTSATAKKKTTPRPKS